VENKLEMAIAKYRANEERKEKKEAMLKVPDKCSPHSLRGWNTFNCKLKNYLSSIWEASGVPLVYVIHKDPNQNAPAPMYPKQVLIAQAPLRGVPYLANHQNFYRVIDIAVSSSDGWTWICDVKNQDGRAAMIKLCDHFDGARSKTCCVQDTQKIDSNPVFTRMKCNFLLTSM